MQALRCCLLPTSWSNGDKSVLHESCKNAPRLLDMHTQRPTSCTRRLNHLSISCYVHLSVGNDRVVVKWKTSLNSKQLDTFRSNQAYIQPSRLRLSLPAPVEAVHRTDGPSLAPPSTPSFSGACCPWTRARRNRLPAACLPRHRPPSPLRPAHSPLPPPPPPRLPLPVPAMSLVARLKKPVALLLWSGPFSRRKQARRTTSRVAGPGEGKVQAEESFTE